MADNAHLREIHWYILQVSVIVCNTTCHVSPVVAMEEILPTIYGVIPIAT
jgi:hypothetical protein